MVADLAIVGLCYFLVLQKVLIFMHIRSKTAIRELLPAACWAAMYLLLLLFFKHEYLSRLNFWLGLGFAPLIGRFVSSGKSLTYGLPALAFGVFLLIEPSNMAYYFCACFGILFVLESRLGKLNALPLFLVVVMSPVFQYIADIWSFPIRLKMSSLAGRLLNLAGHPVEVAGNSLYLDGQEFSVDPACMGLNLLTTSLLLTLLILGYFEKKLDRQFRPLEIFAWLSLTVALSIASNLNRLIALVLFKVMPYDPSHDAWGLFGLAVYILLPLFLLLKWRSKRLPPIPEKPLWQSPYLQGFISIALLILLVFKGIAPQHEPTFQALNLSAFQLPGFKTTLTPKGILKFEGETALVYIKPPTGYLRASHDPRICWQGSGFEFKRVEKTKLGGLEVYTAILVKGNESLYTAWWYDNGHLQPVEETEWRWAGLFGEPTDFQLINITCQDRAMLENQVPALKNAIEKLLP